MANQMIEELDTLLDQATKADPLFVATSFWQTGGRALEEKIRQGSFSTFKDWSESLLYFYQSYGQGYDMELADELWAVVEKSGLRSATRPWLNQQLLGAAQAQHDLDVAIARWNQTNWPFDFKHFGESDFGAGRSRTYALFGADGPRYSRTYLSYLKILSEVSQFIKKPPKKILEIGGGYGSLGEIILSRDPSSTYVDVDIPPTALIAAEYLCNVFGQEFVGRSWQEGSETYRDQAAKIFASWDIEKISGDFDLFLNCYSFQEMEPCVVENYIAFICNIRPSLIVSLNSRLGKPMKSEATPEEAGVIEQVISPFIEEQFRSRGYRLLSRQGRPLAPPQAELIVMA